MKIKEKYNNISGGALIFTLVFISSISIISVTSMRNVLYDSKKSFLFKESSIVFNAAQSAIYSAEQYILNLITPTSPDPINNYYVSEDEVDIDSVNWTALANAPDAVLETIIDESIITDLTSDAYIIVYMGEDDIWEESISEEGSETVSGKTAQYFFIYSYAESLQNSRSLVKIIYGKQI